VCKAWPALVSVIVGKAAMPSSLDVDCFRCVQVSAPVELQLRRALDDYGLQVGAHVLGTRHYALEVGSLLVSGAHVGGVHPEVVRVSLVLGPLLHPAVAKDIRDYPLHSRHSAPLLVGQDG